MNAAFPVCALLAATALSSAQTPTKPDTRASSALKIALTIDDLPAEGPVPPHMSRLDVARSVLDTLKRENMPPVYGFVNADKVADYPYQIKVMQMWRAAGNPLGNHTYSHEELDKLSAKAYEKDIARNEPLLKKVSPGTDWHWFRYPYLEEGNTLKKRQEVQSFLAAHGYKVAEITMDFEDYLWNDSYGRCSAKHDEAGIAYLEKSYLQAADDYIGVFRGLSQTVYHRDVSYILLMHIGAFDARMLPRLIALYRERGFTFVTLEEAEKDPVYSEDPAMGYKGGGTLLELLAKKHGVDFPDTLEPYKKLDAVCR